MNVTLVISSTFLTLSLENQPQLLRHQRGENHAAVRVWHGARTAELGRTIPQLHGGEGHTRHPSPRRGQEATGPLEALRGRSGDRRPGHGNVWLAHVTTRAKQGHAVGARQSARARQLFSILWESVVERHMARV